MGIVSYAQNFEDVMLWRALGHIENGFYVDIGAQHPTIDSVSKAFYERGWSGINVEPVDAYIALLQAERGRDANLQKIVSNDNKTHRFYVFPDTGLSTADAGIARRHQKSGFICEEVSVSSITLDAILAQAPDSGVHWLKVDVEGHEKQVFEGWQQFSIKRPLVVVVESTLPNLQVPNHRRWHGLLAGKGYKFVYFDGLNRFYIAQEHLGLKKYFKVPPNVFDGFSMHR